jgi:peptidyl-prolyl cis-trans isomerase SurA
MNSLARHTLIFGGLLLAAIANPAGPGTDGTARADIRYIVNNVPITDYDISRRTAFLKLQRQSGNLREKAGEAMIEQTLRYVEMKRLKVNISDAQLNEAYKRFAKQNKVSVKQFDNILKQSGVTKKHFLEFMKVQMGWGQALRARFRATSQPSEQDIVQRMLQQGGDKPKATEYLLQQVIFVVPAAQRAKLLKTRKREAEAMRQRFTGCAATRSFAKGLIDVTVRDLGRVLEPQLPPDWEEPIKAANEGGTTPVRETPRGVEFIAICRARLVSDDQVARLVFQKEGSTDEKAEELDARYLEELRDVARIIVRD